MTYSIRTIRGGVTAPSGFKASGMACGIKKTNIPDLALISSGKPASVAGVFTRNRVVAAPVLWTRKVLRTGTLRAVIVNSGNANACTGEHGLKDAEVMARQTGRALSLRTEDVAVASTGVIGQALPIDKIHSAIPVLATKLSGKGGAAAARAIMTTDTFPKSAALAVRVEGKTFRIGGIAKGSGMIHPDMATMLAFVTTDAGIAPPLLKKALKAAVDNSFNRITVDGDTSTNDTVLLLANGASSVNIHAKNLHTSGFQEALNRVCLDLAQQIVQDGEGATKFVTIRVVGGKTGAHCLKLAKQVATSNLVKTALFGEDANWGRILSSAGTAGVPIDPNKIDIRIGGISLVRGGIARGPDQEKKATKALRKKKVTISVNLNSGNAEAEVYTCDLSYDYVRINADYRS
jgi:glutamate N-acetyltransferase/amino-acid N-acetyltransferase